MDIYIDKNEVSNIESLYDKAIELLDERIVVLQKYEFALPEERVRIMKKFDELTEQYMSVRSEIDTRLAPLKEAWVITKK